MLKKFLLTFIVLNLFNFAFAQSKTPVEVVGKNKGKVNVIIRQDVPFVAARSFGRILGMGTAWFGASGQLELTQGSKKAVLTKNQNYALINKQKKALQAAPFEQDKVLYAPLSFFNQFSSYSVAYDQNKIIVERRYTLNFIKQTDSETSSKLLFQAKAELPFRMQKATSDKVEIFFPGAIVKRDAVLNEKNNFIYRTRITQRTKGVEIISLLKKPAKHWDFYYNGKDFIFEAGIQPINRIFVSEQETSSKEQVKEDSSSGDLARPSVLQEQAKEQEDIIELEDFFDAEERPVQISKPGLAADKPVITATKMPVNKVKDKLRVLIDPGHGGKDPGAIRKGSAKEKELNLKVAKQIYSLLSKEKNVEVKMTRTDDTFISLGQRAKMSVEFDSDIFISVHTNAAKKSSANGFEVYFRSDKASDADAAQTAALENEALQYEGKTSNGLSFADLLLQSLATNENINQSSKLAAHIRLLAAKDSGKTGIKVFNNSAIKQANFYVLKGVRCPAVLVEMGYVSNYSDRKRLNNKNTQTQIAKIIAKGVLTYAKEEGWK